MTRSMMRSLVLGALTLRALVPTAHASQPPVSVRTRIPAMAGASEGHCLMWPAGEPLIVHPQACSPTEPDCAGRQARVSQAFHLWDEALAGCTSLRLTEGAAPASRRVGYAPEGPNENVLVLRERACTPAEQGSEDADCWDHGAELLASTTNTVNLRTGQLLDADIELNTVAIVSQAPGDGLREIVLHELGHALGLEHSPDSRSTMYARLRPGAPPVIDEGSRQAMCAIYPPGAPAVDCGPEAPGPQLTPCGCGAAWEGAGAGWLGLGALALARRPRRVVRG